MPPCWHRWAAGTAETGGLLSHHTGGRFSYQIVQEGQRLLCADTASAVRFGRNRCSVRPVRACGRQWRGPQRPARRRDVGLQRRYSWRRWGTCHLPAWFVRAGAWSPDCLPVGLPVSPCQLVETCREAAFPPSAPSPSCQRPERRGCVPARGEWGVARLLTSGSHDVSDVGRDGPGQVVRADIAASRECDHSSSLVIQVNPGFTRSACVRPAIGPVPSGDLVERHWPDRC